MNYVQILFPLPDDAACRDGSTDLTPEAAAARVEQLETAIQHTIVDLVSVLNRLGFPSTQDTITAAAQIRRTIRLLSKNLNA